jgi:hypothetical protein
MGLLGAVVGVVAPGLLWCAQNPSLVLGRPTYALGPVSPTVLLGPERCGVDMLAAEGMGLLLIIGLAPYFAERAV